MITPKEKALELYKKFYPRATSYSSDRKDQIGNTKECTKIVVEEILGTLSPYLGDGNARRYWTEVWNELDEL